MAIHFDCDWCTQSISVDESKAREKIECPHCNRPVKVPAKSTYEPLPSLPESSPASSADAPASRFDPAVSEPILKVATMEAPNDKRPRFNYRAIVVGAGFLAYGLFAIYTGHLWLGRKWGHGPSEVFESKDPLEFLGWVGFYLVVGALFFFYGFRGKK